MDMPAQGDNNRVGDAIIIDRVAIFTMRFAPSPCSDHGGARHVASEQRLYGTMNLTLRLLIVCECLSLMNLESSELPGAFRYTFFPLLGVVAVL